MDFPRDYLMKYGRNTQLYMHKDIYKIISVFDSLLQNFYIVSKNTPGKPLTSDLLIYLI